MRRAQDQYDTPAWCVRSLLDSVPVLGPVLEPCCGVGNIIRVLQEYDLSGWGIEIDATRAHQAYESTIWNIYNSDFLEADWVAGRTPATVLTNPPYSLAPEFLARSLEWLPRGGSVYFLMRLNWLSPKRNRPIPTFDELAGVYVLPERPSFTGDGKTDATEYAWLHWVKDFSGPARFFHLDLPTGGM